MEPRDLAVLGDENLAATWAVLAGVSAHGRVEVTDTLTMTATGLPIAFFNGAYVRAATADPALAIETATSFYAALGLPWLLWVRDGVDDHLLMAGRAAGLRESTGPPAMVLAPIPEPPPVPAGLQITPVTTDEGLGDHAALLADGFEMPRDVVDAFVRPGLLDEPSVTAFVGRVDGVCVSTALLSVSGPTAGVYDVATPEAFRGRGYGAALTWAVVTEGARRGCPHVVLQASDAGYPVYRRMGFVDVGRYRQLVGPPAVP